MTDISFTYEVTLVHVFAIVILLVLFSILEWKRKKRNRLIRILAVSIALLSLYIIFLNPVVSIEKPYKSVVLIGENVTESLSNYFKEFAEYEVFVWDKSTHLLQSKDGKKSYSFQQLDYAIDTLFVRGYLPPINTEFYRHIIYSDTVTPNYDIDFPERVYLGDTIMIRVTNTSTETLSIKGIVSNDTLKIQNIKSQENFSVTSIPKTTGFIHSQLQIDEDEIYHFSTLVEKQSKYMFHLLAETPDFEWRFLKDFLTDEGHAVYFRSKISKAKYKTDFSNWPDSLNRQFRTFKPEYLNILVADMQAWNSLAKSEKTKYISLLKSQQGIVLFRANANERLYLNSIFKPLKGQVYVSDNEENFDEVKTLAVNTETDFVTDNNQHLNYLILPEFSIGIVKAQDTYKWKLAGKEVIYGNYWTEIFSKLLREPAVHFKSKTKWPVQYQPFHLQYWTSDPTNSISIVNEGLDTVKQALFEDDLFKERNHLVFYPSFTGWHQILSSDQTTIDQFYVHPAASSSQNLMNLSYNFSYKKYLEDISSRETVISSNNKDKSLIVWFFLLFLLSISFLWIEEKL